jgi:diguanylate cyclase
MAYGRGKMLFEDGVMGADAARAGGLRQARVQEPLCEVDTLRMANRLLLRELALVKEREMQMQRLADRDALTGLFNRRRLLELLDSSIAEAAQHGQSVGLLFVDLNGFKGVNDEYGHAAGDKVLTTVAKRLAARVRAGDIVGRYGGDEFIVILPDIPDAAAVSRVADTLRQRVALPYRWQGIEQHLTAAIGESLYPQDGGSAAILLQRADEAMYRLKAHLARPMVSIGSLPVSRPARRRSDKSKSA